MVTLARPFDTWDVLKLAAIVLMFVDHTGLFLLNDDAAAYYLRALGRGGMPIFLFLAGYARSYKFSWELFGLACLLSGFEWVYFWHIDTLNSLFTILICRAIFQWFQVRGRVIKRPHEWYIGGVLLFVLGAVTEYGTMGFIMALAGYIRRHESAYPRRLRFTLFALIYVTYVAFQVTFFKPPISLAVTILSAGVMFLWCLTFTLKEVQTAWMTERMKRAAKLVSKYSGYIYVGHLLLLIALTGVPL